MMADKIQLTAGVFVVIALIAVGSTTTYFITKEDQANAYFCEDRDIIGLCWKVSGTRCYYNESAITRYKFCKTDWIALNETDIKTEFEVTKEVILSDIVERPKEIESERYDDLLSLGATISNTPEIRCNLQECKTVYITVSGTISTNIPWKPKPIHENGTVKTTTDLLYELAEQYKLAEDRVIERHLINQAKNNSAFPVVIDTGRRILEAE